MPAYPPLELGQPGRPACPDQYTGESTIACVGATKLITQISLAGIFLSFGEGIGGVIWGVDEPYLPVVGILVRSFDAIRVRNYTAGVPAQVLLIPVSE